eukprot:scaffold603_cov404-Prasinococcus_capsulatus_cf.AAC.42
MGGGTRPTALQRLGDGTGANGSGAALERSRVRDCRARPGRVCLRPEEDRDRPSCCRRVIAAARKPPSRCT